MAKELRSKVKKPTAKERAEHRVERRVLYPEDPVTAGFLAIAPRKTEEMIRKEEYKKSHIDDGNILLDHVADPTMFTPDRKRMFDALFVVGQFDKKTREADAELGSFKKSMKFNWDWSNDRFDAAVDALRIRKKEPNAPQSYEEYEESTFAKFKTPLKPAYPDKKDRWEQTIPDTDKAPAWEAKDGVSLTSYGRTQKYPFIQVSERDGKWIVMKHGTNVSEQVQSKSTKAEAIDWAKKYIKTLNARYGVMARYIHEETLKESEVQ